MISVVPSMPSKYELMESKNNLRPTYVSFPPLKEEEDSVRPPYITSTYLDFEDSNIEVEYNSYFRPRLLYSASESVLFLFNYMYSVGYMICPYALSLCGWSGIVVLMLLSYIAYYSSLLVEHVQRSLPFPLNFLDLCEHSHGLYLGRFGALSLFIVEQTLNLSIFYEILIIILKRAEAVIIIVILASSVTVSPKVIERVTYVGSTANVISFIIITVLASREISLSIYHSGGNLSIDLSHSTHWYGSTRGMFIAFGCFAYVTTTKNVVIASIFSALKDRDSFSRVFSISKGICFCMNMIIAVIGYAAYGVDSHQNILTNILITNEKGKDINIYDVVIVLAFANAIIKYLQIIVPLSNCILLIFKSIWKLMFTCVASTTTTIGEVVKYYVENESDLLFERHDDETTSTGLIIPGMSSHMRPLVPLSRNNQYGSMPSDGSDDSGTSSDGDLLASSEKQAFWDSIEEYSEDEGAVDDVEEKEADVSVVIYSVDQLLVLERSAENLVDSRSLKEGGDRGKGLKFTPRSGERKRDRKKEQRQWKQRLSRTESDASTVWKSNWASFCHSLSILVTKIFIALVAYFLALHHTFAFHMCLCGCVSVFTSIVMPILIFVRLEKSLLYYQQVLCYTAVMILAILSLMSILNIYDL